MTRNGHSSGRTRPKGPGGANRLEPTSDEDRPFADIRRTTHDVLRLLSLRRWSFFVPFCVVTCSAFILSLYYPRTYRATTSFERRNDPVMMNLPMSAGAASYKYFRNTMVRDLTSLDYMGEVVENLGLLDDAERDDQGELTDSGKRRRDALARSFAGTLKVSTTSPSEHIDIIQIVYTGPDPTIGRRLVDGVKRTYIRQTMIWIHDNLTGQRDYFLSELEEVQEEVKQAQRKDTRLRLENPHVDPMNPGAIVLKLEQLERDRKAMVLRKREYKDELSLVEQTLAAIDPRIMSDFEKKFGETFAEPATRPTEIASAVVVELASRIHEIDRQVQDLRTTRGMTDFHPQIQAFLRQRAHLEGEFQQYSPEQRHLAANGGGLGIVPPTTTATSHVSEQAWSTERARLLVQVSAQRAKLKEVDITLGTNQNEIEDLRRAKGEIFEKQEAFARVVGDVRMARQKLSKLQATLASIEPAIKAVEQNRLLQFSEGLPARGSSIPISPRSMAVVGLSLFAGLAVGILFVVLAEVFDQVLRSSSQVARMLGLPMLETIDEIVTSVDRRRLFVRKVVISPLVVAAFIGITAMSGSLAYLSLQRPWTYQRISQVPRAVIRLFAGTDQAEPQTPDPNTAS